MHYSVRRITSTLCTVYVIIVFSRFQPTQEEREVYKNYAGDKNLLPLADIFLLKVCASIFLWHFIYVMYIHVHVHMKFNRPTALVHVVHIYLLIYTLWNRIGSGPLPSTHSTFLPEVISPCYVLILFRVTGVNLESQTLGTEHCWCTVCQVLDRSFHIAVEPDATVLRTLKNVLNRQESMKLLWRTCYSRQEPIKSLQLLWRTSLLYVLAYVTRKPLKVSEERLWRDFHQGWTSKGFNCHSVSVWLAKWKCCSAYLLLGCHLYLCKILAQTP